MIRYDLLSLMAVSADTIKPRRGVILYSGCICDGDDWESIVCEERVG